MSVFKDISNTYQRHIIDPGKERAFWLLVAFLLTFLVVRTITHMIRANKGPFHNISAKGKHIHHLVPGIILISGYCSISLHLHHTLILDSVAFGVGAALTLDEFALWLNLADVYWSKQGRDSVDAVIIMATVASLVVLGPGFWKDIFKDIFGIINLYRVW
jgi:hypothetical protein